VPLLGKGHQGIVVVTVAGNLQGTPGVKRVCGGGAHEQSSMDEWQFSTFYHTIVRSLPDYSLQSPGAFAI
jgi:hypothetical protein